jgi:SagB-type dehydrogenase family enzyme
MSLEESAAEQIAKLQVEPQPELIRPNGIGAIPLPKPEGAIASADLLPTMVRRRTNRVGSGKTLTLQQLGDCLYAGLAITGSVETPAGVLPLSITPSGGARNPYEAYVYVSAVEDLQPGFYHYAGAEHSLELVSGTIMEAPETMLAGQDWVHTMPAIILLVAHFERTMWKYQDANSYRVILIEAGHIGQNIMLAATAHGLSACPTAALHHETIRQALDISDCLHVPIYALTLSHPEGPGS